MEDNSFYAFIDSNIIRLLLGHTNRKLVNGTLESLVIPYGKTNTQLFEKIKKYVNSRISSNIRIETDFNGKDKEKYDEGTFISQDISAIVKKEDGYQSINYKIYYM